MVAKHIALSADTSTRTKVFYPETDDMPLPDGLYQHSHFWEIISILNYFFRLRDDVVVAGDVFIYYVEGHPNVRIAPDCFVVFGVSRESFERNNTYLMWEVGQGAGLRVGDRFSEHGSEGPGRQARVVRESWDRGVLAVRSERRRPLWGASGGRGVGGRGVP